MIHSGLSVFHFCIIFFEVIYYIRSKWQVEPELIVSLKYYQLCILASNQKWETGLVVMALHVV